MLLKDAIHLAVQTSPASRLQSIVDRAGQETTATYAFLFLWDRETSEAPHIFWYGREPDSGGEDYVAVARRVVSAAEPLFIGGQSEAEETLSLAMKDGLPLICVPVAPEAGPAGALGVGSPVSPREEFAKCLPRVVIYGELAGALLENDALRQDLEGKQEQVHDLVSDTLEAQERERERICLEVHDGVSQTLASAFQYLQTVDTALPQGTPARQLLLKARTLVKQAIQETREVIDSLQPAILRDLGLITTLRQEMRQLEQETGWDVDFTADPIRLPHDVETGLYRIIHEAITNVRKHADSKRLRVNIASNAEKVMVEVVDWGTGFIGVNYDRPNVYGRRTNGLFSMRRRAELLGGACDIRSVPGQGTQVLVNIPYQRS
ncbi:MAG: sensor histidine kinase [Chloroflexi bacterium]|nr:sensor histidine kinase [Chloroflexota bacterium]